jgi:hypothetical protein
MSYSQNILTNLNVKKSSLLLSFLLLFISCSKELGCEKILQKEIINGKYYFYWGERINSQDTYYEPLVGSVSKEAYDSINIGDTYCFD